MKHTQTFDVEVLDGSIIDRIVLKGNFECENFAFERDLTNTIVNKVKIIDKEQKLSKGDILRLNKNDILFFGKITMLEIDNTNICNCNVVWDSDVYEYTAIIPTNSFSFSNGTTFGQLGIIKYISNGNYVATSTDNTLLYPQILRQILRNSNAYEKKTIGTFLNITYQDRQATNYFVRQDDDYINDVKVDLATDTSNVITVINSENPNQHKTFYFKENGVITENISDLRPEDFPLVETVEKVDPDKVDIQTATSIFKQQEYQNEISFSYFIDKVPENLAFTEDILGRKLTFVTKNNQKIKSIISNYSLKGNIMSVKLGLSRKKLTSKLSMKGV